MGVQNLIDNNTSENTPSCDSKKKTEDETAESNEKKAEETTKGDIKEEKEEKYNKSETGDSLHSTKKLLFLEEKKEEDANNRKKHEKQVNKMSEMKQIMTNYFGSLKKTENKKYTKKMLMEDNLNKEIQKAEFAETDIPEKRELSPSVLIELKTLVQKLMEIIQFERLNEVDYTFEDQQNIILAEMIFPEEDELKKIHLLNNDLNVIESVNAEDSVHAIKDQENKEDVNDYKEVIELEQMSHEYLEAIGEKNLNARKISKTSTENKTLFMKIVQNALETIVEEENVEESNKVSQSDIEHGKSSTQKESQKSDPNISTEEEANVSLDFDDKNVLLTREPTPFRRHYFRTIRKSNKKKL